jgi:hypothetical protein
MIFGFERSKLQGLGGPPVGIEQRRDCWISESFDIPSLDGIPWRRVLLSRSTSEKCTSQNERGLNPI